jgi:hypothetical protein
LELNFTNLLWAFIAAVDVALVIARMFIERGPLRLSMALAIPALIIVGAIINAIYNRVKTGHALNDLPGAKPQR